MQILYVEDDKLLAKTVELMLQKEGHFCHTTNLGEDAVELAKRNEYDIIVLDIMLPDIDGFEVINRLRANGITTPYLIQTGLVDRDSPESGLRSEYEELLVKPFGKQELIERVESTAARGAPRKRPETPVKLGAAETVTSEHRQHRRFKTVKAGEIVLASQSTRCVILDISQGGASIRLPRHLLDCPNRFTLKIQSGDTHECEVAWRDRDKIGVKFLED